MMMFRHVFPLIHSLTLNRTGNFAFHHVHRTSATAFTKTSLYRSKTPEESDYWRTMRRPCYDEEAASVNFGTLRVILKRVWETVDG